MARDFKDLISYDLTNAKGTLNVLTGVSFKKGFKGTVNGNLIDNEDSYFVDRITDGVVGTWGFTSSTIVLTPEEFEKFFGDEQNFVDNWIFKPVMLGIQEVKTKKNMLTLTYVIDDPRCPLIKGGGK